MSERTREGMEGQGSSRPAGVQAESCESEVEEDHESSQLGVLSVFYEEINAPKSRAELQAILARRAERGANALSATRFAQLRAELDREYPLVGDDSTPAERAWGLGQIGRRIWHCRDCSLSMQPRDKQAHLRGKRHQMNVHSERPRRTSSTRQRLRAATDAVRTV